MTGNGHDRIAVIAGILADAIRDLKRVPSGHLYAQVMGHMDIHTYNKAIDLLKRTKMVEEKNHELIWIGRERA